MEERLELRVRLPAREEAGVENEVKEDKAMKVAAAEADIYNLLQEYNQRCCIGEVTTRRVCIGAMNRGPLEEELEPLYTKAAELLNDLRRTDPTHYEMIHADLASEDPLGFLNKAQRYNLGKR